MVRGIDPLVLMPVAVQDVDVSTPASRSVIALGTLSYIVLLTMLMGGLYLSIDATAGERERGSLEPLLTVPVKREQLIYGKILAACAYMTISLVLTVTAFAILLRFVGLERFGMSVNFGPLAALTAILYSLPLVPLGAALMTTVAAFTRSYREAQTYLGMILLIPTLPLVFASMLGLRPTAWLMMVPSLSQHFLITALLRDETVPAAASGLIHGRHAALGGVARHARRAALSSRGAARLSREAMPESDRGCRRRTRAPRSRSDCPNNRVAATRAGSEPWSIVPAPTAAAHGSTHAA